MRISRLYTDENLSAGCTITLDKAASSYLLKVLRLTEGAELHLFNGLCVDNNYGYYQARISSAGKQAEITAEQFIVNNNHSALKISLLQGVSKGDHMDTIIQKAVELGVTEIIPVICERTVVNLKADRLEKKMRHWQGIVISACEQSGRNQLLTVHEPVKFNAVQPDQSQTAFILQPESAASILNSKQTDAVSLFIGPEGGFSDDEITQALDKGFNAVKFGPRVLRTETAAIAAVSIIQSQWGDLN
ncbi:MAG: 16S rRNA (uracil(1498)-N(3))-methyltransferase [Gammaproteobacteria bacterium]|nr:16S rRNA (uracil(1498)-N(3))-methyltransferase [Gammaproteobacteria bacterium]